MSKQNCWEFTRCGREAGGPGEAELGRCPAYTEGRLHGINGGMNGGRACWAVAGTFCNGKIQGTYARKLYDCTRCEFYRLVWDEEGEHYSGAGEILARLYPVE